MLRSAERDTFCFKNDNNYRLRFSNNTRLKHTPRWRGGAATIEESEGDIVWGLVWRLAMSDLESLDVQEGVNFGVYRRLDSLPVTCASDQSTLECVSYQMVDPLFTKPSPHYLRVLQKGAEQHNLPEDYQRFLATIEHNGYEGSIPVFDEIVKMIKL